MEVTRTFLRSQRNQQIPKQVAQGQTQQKGGYGEEVRQKLETLGDVRREAPVIQAKRVDPIVSPTEQYTKDAVKTALKEELKKFISSRGLGEDKPGDTEKPATFASTGGGGGKKDFFTGLTNDQLGLLSTDQLVARDIKRYVNTVPEGSFGSGSLKTIQDSPGSAVDTNIARHSEGTSEDQPPTVLFQKEKPKGGQGGLPLGTTTLREGEKPTGPAVNASSFQQKNVRGSTSFGGTGKDESERPRQTVAALPSNYKATEAEAFAKAKSYKDSVAKGKAAEKATGIKTKPVAGSFGISEAGKKEAEANRKAAQAKKAAEAKAKADAKAAADKKAKQAAAKKKAEAAKKKQSTSINKSGRKSNTGSKKSSRGSTGRKGSGSKSSGSKSGGSKGTSGSKKASRGAKGSSSSRSKGGSFGGKRRRSNTKRSRRRCDIRCKFDISILTNLNLIKDDLADVAYFVRELKEAEL